MLNVAICAARKAGNLIIKYYDIKFFIENKHNYYNDFITTINYKAERVIVETIHHYYPNHAIFSKKGDITGKKNEIKWIIEPLNGINNFIKRFPYFSISISVRINSHTEIAVTYDPIRNELFTASRGRGAQLNGYRIRGSTAKNLKTSILVTSFPKEKTMQITSYIILFRKILFQCLDFRYTGSLALDLAYIAAGRVDILFEIGIKFSDITGGELLVREAGCIVTDLIDYNNYSYLNIILAGNPSIVQYVISTIRKISQ